jgi:hypothetical protein
MKLYENFLNYLRSNPVYLDVFDSRESVFSHFEKSEDPDIQILYASYSYECYEGYASVIFYRESTGKYYEIYGSHCSCYGLEGQWDREEEVLPVELFNRLGELKGLYEKWEKQFVN